jgi:hypothetical protein
MRRFLIVLLLVTISIISFSQSKFRSGIFLHHSTGDNIWGPNGSATSIPQEIAKYNTFHTYSAGDAISMDQLWWPDGANSGNNEWECWHRIFENKDLANSDIRGILAANKIVVIKSCFPSSALDRLGQLSDTLSPTEKTIYNYKWHWRHIVKAMKQHPGVFFAIWTNAPLTSGQSDATAADLSKKFCKWAKDTLAKGLDPIIGTFPKNIYVFDYFSKLTDANGYLKNQYAVNSGDSHPNDAATALIAPQFVSEIFDAAISYEGYLLGVEKDHYLNLLLYPNPSGNDITVRVSSLSGDLKLYIYNVNGQKLLSQPVDNYLTRIDIASLSQGIYYLKVTDGKRTEVRKIVRQ